MGRSARIAALTFTAILAFCSSALAVDSVWVAPMSFLAANQAGVICSIYVSNDQGAASFVLPIEMRKSIGETFITAASHITTNPAGRMHTSPLGTGTAETAPSITARKYPAPDGVSCSQGANTYTTSSANVDFVSPDGFMWVSISQGDPGAGEQTEMAAGIDAAGVHSLQITVTVNDQIGCFLIDTVCVRPANHLAYTDDVALKFLPKWGKGLICVGVSDVKELETGVIPEDYSLEQNYPNPFNAGTVIRFKTPIDGDVHIDVYNILGNRVRTLVNEFRVAGTHQTDWDGRDDNGSVVATGVYFYRINAAAFNSTRKMVLLK